MTEQTKAVFENPQLLREKLLAYLQTPEKVEIYAQAAEKFFNAGMRMGLKFTPTWSWWGFFGNIWYLFYRKLNKEGLIYLAALLLLGWIPVLNAAIMFAVPIAGKYFVIKRFEQALDMNNEMLFMQMSGVAKWAIYVAVGISILAIVLAIAGFAFLGIFLGSISE